MERGKSGANKSSNNDNSNSNNINVSEREILPHDVGARRLTERQIEHLRHIIGEVYSGALSFQTMDKATRKIAEMFLKEDINFEYTFKIFENIDDPTTAFKIVKDVYNNPIPGKDIYPLHEILSSPYDISLESRTAKKIENGIYSTIRKNPFEGMITANVGNDIAYINNHIRKQIIYKQINEKNGIDYGKEKTVINGSIKELIVFDSPLNEDPRRFKAIFDINKRDKLLELGPMLIDDITSSLSESGYVLASRLVKDALPSIFNAFIECDKAIIKNEIEYPGFFYDKDSDSIISIEYELEDIKPEKLKAALNLLEDFAGYFDDKVKLAHVLKWGLISPFIFAIKQKGKWVNHLFLYGKAGSGKTTLADMVLYLWSSPDSNINDIGGSSFNTEARVGEKLKQFTFPIVVNEPQGALEKPGVVEMLKSSIERTNSRAKFEGKFFKNLLALSPVIYTSNYVLPDDDALIRRMDCLSFSHNERKTEEQKETFKERFNTENKQDCLLHGLKPLAQYFANEIIEDPKFLDLNWKDLANELVTRVYMDAGLKAPEWILNWSKTETLEDRDDLQIERIRIFLQDEINRAYGTIQIYEEDGYTKDNFNQNVNAKSTEDFKSRLWTVANERKIPYLYVSPRESIYLTQGFADALNKDTGINESLKSLSELLGWKSTNNKVGKERISGRNIKIDFETFLNFVFPSFEEDL